jgi:hypothetical protein
MDSAVIVIGVVCVAALFIAGSGVMALVRKRRRAELQEHFGKEWERVDSLSGAGASGRGADAGAEYLKQLETEPLPPGGATQLPGPTPVEPNGDGPMATSLAEGAVPVTAAVPATGDAGAVVEAGDPGDAAAPDATDDSDAPVTGEVAGPPEPVVMRGSPFTHGVDSFRRRWVAIQIGLPDDPRRTVEQAHQLVTDVAEDLVDGFRRERAELERHWATGERVPNEDLRRALQRYQDAFDRLFGA